MKKVNFIDCNEWDKMVRKTYERPYNFQQQDGCKYAGIFEFKVPMDPEDYDNNTLPEKINGDEMGVSFASWLSRDPTSSVNGDKQSWSIKLFWHRNFYPHVSMLVNDLYSKGFLKKGEYIINIY